MSSCNCSGDSTLIYACSGAADVGELSDKIARNLRSKGIGKMFCLAALGADVSGYIDTANCATTSIVIDGCPTACGKKAFERHSVDNRAFVLTDMGCEKGKTVIDQDVIDNLSDRIIENLNN